MAGDRRLRRCRFGKWSELPSELLEDIILKLHLLEEVASFSCVCRAWLTAFRRIRRAWCADNPWGPWLLLSENTRDNSECVRKAYNPSNNKYYNLKLPETFGRNYWGSGLGWIVTFGLDLEINLVNPLTKSRISLPSIDTMMPEEVINCDNNCKYRPYLMRASQIRKAYVLNIGGDNGGLVVAVIHVRKRDYITVDESSYLSIAKPEDANWTLIQTPEQMLIKDVLFWKDLLWLIDSTYSLWYVDIVGSCFKAVQLSIEPPHRYWEFDNYYHDPYFNGELDKGPIIYLAESPDDNKLVLVERHWYTKERIVTTITRKRNGVVIKDDICPKCEVEKTLGEEYSAFTERFRIFVLDISTQEWEKVHLSDLNAGLGNMFLGENTSLVASTPEKGTSACIYFAGDSVFRSRHDTGIDYGKGIKPLKLEALDQYNDDVGFCDPVWFMPRPWSD